MMIKVTYYKYSQNQLKTDQPYSMKSFKEETTKVSEQAILRAYLYLLKNNKEEEVILQIYDFHSQLFILFIHIYLCYQI
jgi:hypothetical protein